MTKKSYCKNLKKATFPDGDYWLTSGEYHDINSEMVSTFEPYKAEIYPQLRQRAREKKLAHI
jgi:hypothetical protein